MYMVIRLNLYFEMARVSWVLAPGLSAKAASTDMLLFFYGTTFLQSCVSECWDLMFGSSSFLFCQVFIDSFRGFSVNGLNGSRLCRKVQICSDS